MSTRKGEVETLLRHFGTCRCTRACQVEQYADEDMQDKPGGRFSVCELEADRLGIPVPEKEDP